MLRGYDVIEEGIWPTQREVRRGRGRRRTGLLHSCGDKSKTSFTEKNGTTFSKEDHMQNNKEK